MNNFEYHQKRVEEVRELFSFLHDRVSLEGDRFLSIGCGTAPEFEFLSETFRDLVGIDQNIELDSRSVFGRDSRQKFESCFCFGYRFKRIRN